MQQSIEKIQNLIEQGSQLKRDVLENAEADFLKFVNYTKDHQNKKVIILCGITGAGKSTIYNWLAGAKILLNAQNCLEAQANEQMLISPIGQGSESVTQTICYQYVQDLDHILVDFPGFESTKSEIHELYVDLLFKKITNEFNTKIVYLLENPQFKIANRGKDYKKFIEEKIMSFPTNGEKVNLILNLYNEYQSDNQLIQNFKDTFSSDQKLKNNLPKYIKVIQKVNNQNQLNTILSKQNRDDLIKNLVFADEVKLEPVKSIKLQQCQLINDFLISTSQFFFNCLSDMGKKIYEKTNQNEIFDVKLFNLVGACNMTTLMKIKAMSLLYKALLKFERSYEEEEGKLYKIFCDIYLYFSKYREMFSCFKNIEDQTENEEKRVEIIQNYIQQINKTNSEENKEELIQNQIANEIGYIRQNNSIQNQQGGNDQFGIEIQNAQRQEASDSWRQTKINIVGVGIVVFVVFLGVVFWLII